MWLLFAIAGVLGVTFWGINSAKKRKDAEKHEHSHDESKEKEKTRGKRYIKKTDLERIREKNRARRMQGKKAEPTQIGGKPPVTGVPAPKVEPVKVGQPKIGPVKVGGTPPVTGVPAPKVVPVRAEEPKKVSPAAINAARKELKKLEKTVLYERDVKKPSEVIARKIDKMPNVDVKALSKTDRKDHQYHITSAVMKKWDAETTKVHDKVVGLMEDLDKGEDPQEVLDRRPQAPSFKGFVEGSDKLITVTSEKYDYYHVFILEKSREVLKLLGPIDPRRTEIENIVKRVSEKIDHFDSSLDDFLVFVETDLVKMEKIEKEIKDIQKTESARKVKKDIEKYKSDLLSGKTKEGKTVESLIENRMKNMEIEGKISLASSADKEGILKVVKTEWDKMVGIAVKKCDSLATKLSDKASSEEVAKMIPTLTIEKFINSPECRGLVANTYQKMAVMHRYGEQMKKEFANNLGLLKDEELKKFVHEQMDSLSADITDPKVTPEAFKQKSKVVVDAVLEKVLVTSNKMLAEQKAAQEKQAGLPENMTVTQSGIIIPKQEQAPKKEIILPNSTKR